MSDNFRTELVKAETAMRQAFDLFNLGAEMLNKGNVQTTTQIGTTKPAVRRSRPKKTQKPKTVVSFDTEDELTTPEEGEDEFDVDDIDKLDALPLPKAAKKKTDEDYYISYADDYINFTAQNPTTFHVVRYFSQLLESKGFTYLSEKEAWEDLKPGLYYTTRSGTSLGAFAIGKDWVPEYGAGIIGSHIDALATKLKPVSKKSKVDGYELLGVAPYAGALSPAWFDRDLGLAGRVLIKYDDKGSASGFKVVSKLINSSPKPIARISTLAPHFGAVADPPYDPETRAIPVIAYSPGSEAEPTESEKKSILYGKHSLELLRYIAELSESKVEDLIQLDLDLFDVQKGTIGGLKDDFIYAPRIDDRICSYSAISALLEFSEKEIPGNTFVQVLLYDNEEIGSLTRQGAKSTLINTITERVIGSKFGKDVENLTKVSFANTIVLSADVTHLLNPVYKSEYLENHYPLPNTGVTIALDPNGHMATDSVGLALVEAIAKQNDDVLQYFQIKNGARSGGTIGPSISTETGARTIDLGIPQLSMHSIRASTGVKDVGLAVKFFRGFYQKWRDTYDSFHDL
jgi:aminopeptidase I